MSQINLKSITGITSITTPAGVDNQLTLHNNNTTEAVKLDIAGNLHFHNHLNITGVTTFATDVSIADKIVHTGDENTSIRFPSADTIRLETGGATRLTLDSNGNTLVSGGLYAQGDSYISDSIIHDGDTNTKIRFPSNDTITAETGGGERLRIDSLGNVSIGGINPVPTSTSYYSASLHIHQQSNNSTSGAQVHLTTANKGSAAGDGAQISQYNGNLYINNQDDGNMYFLNNSNSTIRMTITSGGALGFAGANYGSSGQVLTSQGSGSAPTWTTISGTTINNNADNRVITGSGSANTLNGESNVQIDSGGRLSVGNSQASTQYDQSNDLVIGNTTGSHGMTIISANDNRGRIMFSDTYSANTGRYAGQMLYDHQTETINWYSNYTNNAAVAMQLGGDQNQLFVGIDKGSTSTFNNRSAYFHRDPDNYISITGSGTAGIVFGDTIANNGGNYETYMHHTNSTNDFWIRVNQGNDNRHLKITQAGNVEIGNGNLVMASGHGIDFSDTNNATNSASMQNELLDDYEEGTWTPFFYAWIGGGVPATTDIAVGTYTKIGRCVHINFDLKADRGSMNHNYITMGGLPFAHLGSRGGFASIAWTEYVGSENSTSATRGHGLEFGGGATVHAWLTGYTNTSNYLPTYLSTSYMSNGSHTRIIGSATYFTNA